MAPFNVNKFKAEINNQGELAEPNKFRCLITGGVLNTKTVSALVLLINQASIPGRALTTSEIRTHGPIRKAPYNTIYDDLQLGIYCTNNKLFPRDLFEEWQNSIISTKTGLVNYFDQYVADIDIEQYDNKQNIIFSCKFIDAYPIIVAPLGLDWATTNAYHNLNVTFAYRKWELQRIPNIPFGNNIAINQLYPNIDLASIIDNGAITSQSGGQWINPNTTKIMIDRGNEWINPNTVAAEWINPNKVDF